MGECNRLWAEGVRAKDLPKKPKHSLKPNFCNEERLLLLSSEDEG